MGWLGPGARGTRSRGARPVPFLGARVGTRLGTSILFTRLGTTFLSANPLGTLGTRILGTSILGARLGTISVCDAVLRHGIRPDDFSYNSFISACKKGKELRLAVNVLDAMVRQGIKPDIVSYSALISACAKGQELRVAVNVCDAMQRQSVGHK